LTIKKIAKLVNYKLKENKMIKYFASMIVLLIAVGCSKDIPTTVCTTTENAEAKTQGGKK
jgi:hypothetical protein